MTADLDNLKALARLCGYRFETDSDGTERMIRPDGTTAITATKNVQRVWRNDNLGNVSERSPRMSEVPMMDEVEGALVASRIPDYMHKGLIDYIRDGHPPGGFLIAVLTNDLKNAATAADGNNQRLLYDYVTFLYNYAPSPCWGSPAAVKEWVARGGLVGVLKGVQS